MQTYSYTLETTPQASGRTNITKTVDLTGTTKVTFALSGLSAYDASIADAAASKNYRINKIIVDFDDPDTTEDNLVLNRRNDERAGSGLHLVGSKMDSQNQH